MKLSLAKTVGITEGVRVLDVGCGQGTFTVCVARLVGKTGKVVAVDVSNENLEEMNQNLQRYDVKRRVEFLKTDATNLPTLIARDSFDMAVSYRLIEELKHPKQLPKVISAIVQVVRQNGTVAMIELNTETNSIAEENLISLHRDIGDDFFPPQTTILRCMKRAGLTDINVKTVSTNISYSGEVFLRSNISQDEIWPEFKEKIIKQLWPSVKKHGMKYPPIKVFSGQKRRVTS
ncbi:MAG TPA: methyltransferase domain-containing protein [Candidatus Eisenbacteria bacterium]|nr:methyltransferase domain-containing protein [Candidatus Eisenbacteria bacterium]